MPSTSTIPVMPMRHAVVYPGLPTPLGVSRPISQRAIEAAQRQRGFLFAVAQRTPLAEPGVDDLHRVGVVVCLIEVKTTQGDWEVLFQGVTRARATLYKRDGDHLSASVEPIADVLPDDVDNPQFVTVLHELRERLGVLGKLRGVPEAVLAEVLSTLTEPGTLADFVASYVDLPTVAKQALLETPNVTERLHEALVQLERQIEVERTRDEIRGRVNEEVAGRQRESFLREQLKVIRRELGEDADDDHDELLTRLERLVLPEVVRGEVTREVRRLRRANPDSAEAQVIRTYLEWVGELPWNSISDDVFDLARAAEILEEAHHGLSHVKDRVLDSIAVRALCSRLDGAAGRARRGGILLFQGPPGVGKTTVAASIARALGRAYVRVALGGVHDESEIRGHRRTYVGAMPGRIVDGLRYARTRNPVFVLDEIDKLGSSWHGSPAHALLEVLDPEQNGAFVDHYLGVPFDLGNILFIATANSLDTIPPALLDRMDVVNFEGCGESDKIAIARRFLVPRGMYDAGLVSGPSWSEEALRKIVRERTRESGVRQLEREISTVARKLARAAESGRTLLLEVDIATVQRLLGRPRVRFERALDADPIGTATGLVFSPAGGDIVFVEAAVRALGEPNAGAVEEVSLVLTGQLGEVMRESARAAVTVALGSVAGKAARTRLGGPVEAHVHVPAGAIPKDGPSAGLALVVALVSALSGRRVRRDVALTGEITLSGRVLPVGGVEAKLLGAARAGIRHVVLPRENLDDLGSLPADALAHLVLHGVSDVARALSLALMADADEPPYAIGDRAACGTSPPRTAKLAAPCEGARVHPKSARRDLHRIPRTARRSSRCDSAAQRHPAAAARRVLRHTTEPRNPAARRQTSSSGTSTICVVRRASRPMRRCRSLSRSSASSSSSTRVCVAKERQRHPPSAGAKGPPSMTR